MVRKSLHFNKNETLLAFLVFKHLYRNYMNTSNGINNGIGKIEPLENLDDAPLSLNQTFDATKNFGNDDLGYVRSYNLSIFSLFSINRKDTASILGCFELIDTTFSQRIPLDEFTKKFCPNSVDAFLSIWDKYMAITCLLYTSPSPRD